MRLLYGHIWCSTANNITHKIESYESQAIGKFCKANCCAEINDKSYDHDTIQLNSSYLVWHGSGSMYKIGHTPSHKYWQLLFLSVISTFA